MSVPVKERKSNPMLYVKKGQDLYLRTCTTLGKLEKTYPEIIGKLKELSNDYFIKAYQADTIYIDNMTTKAKFQLRQNFLNEAVASLNGYRAELNLLYYMVKQGDSRLGNKAERDKKFTNIANIIIEAQKLILGVISSDNERWEQWHPSNKQKNKNRDTANKHINQAKKQKEKEAEVLALAQGVALLKQEGKLTSELPQSEEMTELLKTVSGFIDLNNNKDKNKDKDGKSTDDDFDW